MSRFLTGINRDLEEECRSRMLHDNMDLSRLMMHVQKVEDSRKKRDVGDARRPKPQNKAGPSHGSHRNNFGIREQHKSKKGQRSYGILIPSGVKPLEEDDLSLRRETEVRCIFSKREVLSVALIKVKSVDMALMSVLVAVRVGICLETSHRTQVK